MNRLEIIVSQYKISRDTATPSVKDRAENFTGIGEMSGQNLVAMKIPWQ